MNSVRNSRFVRIGLCAVLAICMTVCMMPVLPGMARANAEGEGSPEPKSLILNPVSDDFEIWADTTDLMYYEPSDEFVGSTLTVVYEDDSSKTYTFKKIKGKDYGFYDEDDELIPYVTSLDWWDPKSDESTSHDPPRKAGDVYYFKAKIWYDDYNKSLVSDKTVKVTLKDYYFRKVIDGVTYKVYDERFDEVKYSDFYGKASACAVDKSKTGDVDILSSVKMTDGKTYPVTFVDNGAFSDYDRKIAIDKVTLPDSVTYIHRHGFWNSRLNSITLSKALTKIDWLAFGGCDNLKSITLPKSLTYIEKEAFVDTGLTEITIPESVTFIGEDALGYHWDADANERVRVPGFTIYGKKGSEAERYANDNLLKFVEIEEGTEYPEMVLGTETEQIMKETVNTAHAPQVYYGNNFWYVIGYDGKGVASRKGTMTLLAVDNINNYRCEFNKNDDSNNYDGSNVYDGSFIQGKVNTIGYGSFGSMDFVKNPIKSRTRYTDSYRGFDTDGFAGTENIDHPDIWLLTTKEAYELDPELRKTKTNYSSAQDYKKWWLCSPGNADNQAAFVDENGTVDCEGTDVTASQYGVRPALEISLDSILLTHIYTGGKEFVTDDHKLKPVGNNKSGKWKLTVVDEKLFPSTDPATDFSVDENAVLCDGTDTQVTIGCRNMGLVKLFDNPDIQARSSISGYIVDKDNNITHYGQIKGIKTREEAQSSTITLDLDGIYEPGDKLFIVNELYQGVDLTDYSSKPFEVKIPPGFGHDWEFVDFTWSGDAESGYTVKANYKCKNDENHKKSIDVAISSNLTPPTCTQDGEIEYTATVSADDSPDGNQHTDIKKESIDQTGHDMKFIEFSWTGDDTNGYTAATAVYECKNEGCDHTETANASLKEVTTAPTCEQEGKVEYEASVAKENSPDGASHSVKKEVAIPPAGHDWEFRSFTEWTGNATDGYTGVQGYYRCRTNNDHTRLVKADISEEVIAPTCELGGKTIYTAIITAAKSLDGIEHSMTKEGKPTNAKGHKWKYKEFKWSGSDDKGYSASAIYECENDPTHQDMVNAEITSQVIAPTCEDGGKTVYTATVSKDKSLDGSEHSGIYEANFTEKADHKWKYKDFTWEGDETNGYTKATVNYYCEKDNSHTTTAEATIKENVIPLDCEQDGKIEYKATIMYDKSPDGKKHTNSRDAKITKAPGHEWEFKDFDWTGDETNGYTSAKAVYECKHNADHKRTVDAALSEKTDDPTCTEGGKTTYTATVDKDKSLDGSEHSGSKEGKKKAAKEHSWRFTEFTWEGDETNGYTKAAANYICDNDNDHKETVAAAISENVIALDCEQDGKTTYKATVSKDKSLDGEERTESKDAKVTKAPGHDWEFKDFDWTGDETNGYTSAKAVYECKHNADHKRTVDAALSEKTDDPTCTKEGKTTYTATVDKDKSLDDTEHSGSKEAKIKEAKNHSWRFTEFTWEGDETNGYTKATANYICDNDNDHKETVAADISENVVERECEKDGKTEYKATVSKDKSLDGEERTESKDAKITKATGHNWNETAAIKATFDKDGKVDYECENCHTNDSKTLHKVSDVSLAANAFTYDGTEKKPAVTVKDSEGKELRDDAAAGAQGAAAEYEVAYTNNRNAGSATATVTLKGNYYEGGKELKFTISAKKITPAMKLAASAYTYDGQTKTPAVTVKDGNATLANGKDYSVSYAAGRTNAGSYKVTAKLKGNYQGSATASFVINKAANALDVKGKKVKLRARNLKKKNQTVKCAGAMTISNAKGTVTYKLASVKKAKFKKYFKVNSKSGNITVKKKLKKGKYTVVIKAKAAGDANYNASAEKPAMVTITVK